MNLPYWICPKCSIKHKEPGKHNCAEAVEAAKLRDRLERERRERIPFNPMWHGPGGEWRA